MVHPRGLNHISFVISAVTTTQCSMKKLEKLSLKKNHANHNFVIYIFVNAQKVVHPRGFNHMSFVISAVTTTQCSMKKLEKLELNQSYRPMYIITQRNYRPNTFLQIYSLDVGWPSFTVAAVH